ncbi:protein of unknown function [Nitratireductor aquimarinus]
MRPCRTTNSSRCHRRPSEQRRRDSIARVPPLLLTSFRAGFRRPLFHSFIDRLPIPQRAWPEKALCRWGMSVRGNLETL